MGDFSELKNKAEAAQPGPWHACRDGNCSCATVSCADYPIATITRGKWGDTYPALRLVGPSHDQRAETYMEMIEYGEVSPELATANVAYIAAASPDVVLRLIQIAEAARAHMEAADNCDADAAFTTWDALRSSLGMEVQRG